MNKCTEGFHNCVKEVTVRCPRCGEDCGRQHMFGEGSRWGSYLSINCPECSYRYARLGEGGWNGVPDWEDREIAEGGVYGRDVLQPLDSSGSVNRKFVDRYGDGMLKPTKQSQLDGRGKERK